MGRFNRWEWMKEQIHAKKTLFEDINKISVYRYHRDNLRPWDRRLPPVVEQEANRRQLWVLKPPSPQKIIAMLVICLVLFQLVGVVPIAINEEHINDTWNNMLKPGIVYHDPRVIFACWVVVMCCNGLTMWFIWLAEGFDSHQLEMVPFAALIFSLCIWLDICFYTKRLDWTLYCWIAMLLFTLVSQLLLSRNGVEIGAVFLCPMVGACIVAIVYCTSFISMHGVKFEKLI